MSELSKSIGVNLAESKRLGALLFSSFQVRLLGLGNAFLVVAYCYFDNFKEILMLCDELIKR
jgi:hypothetical protein